MAIDIGTRREVFWDDFLIDAAKTTAELKLHEPVRREAVLIHDAPWEGDGCDYHNIVRDGGVYRMYYLGWKMFGKEKIKVCMAESADGLSWTKPELGLCEFEGSTKNNILLDEKTDRFDNFFVFKDDNPACPPGEKFKGVAANNREPRCTLWCYTSADGIHFSPDRMITDKGYFDTLNTALWDGARGKYFCFVRGFHDIPQSGELNKGIRDIRVLESEDFIHWSEPRLLDFGEGEDYPLYTNVITKYYRAPHVFTGFPSRYVERPGWSDNFEKLCGKEKRLERMARHPRYGLTTTDCVFMSSRDGKRWNRCDEAFMRPGPEYPENWVYGSCYPATGMIETKSDIPGADNEISMYAFDNHWMGVPSVLRRYTVRLDGFMSCHAPYKQKTLATKPFIFGGDRLFINFSTSARGYVKLRLCCGEESLETCELFGDRTDREVGFENGSASRFKGKPVVLEAALSDADLYAFRFE